MEFKYDWNEIYVTSYDQINDVLDEEAINLDFYCKSRTMKVDLSLFNRLRWLGCDYKEVVNLSSQTNLLSLVLFSYPNNGSGLNELLGLKELVLRKGTVESLSFISQKSQLVKIELSYLSKLKTIGSLKKCQQLEYLEIQSCKRICDLEETLKWLSGLKVLKLIGFEIANLRWVKNLVNLEQLILLDTNVIDGDIKPAKNVTYVAIDNKRHYNYKFDDESMRIVPK